MNDILWYQEVENELVDQNNQEEQKIIDAINNSLFQEEENVLAQHALENLSKENLSKFISNECFPAWQTKTYGEIKNLPYINFSLRAALQHIGKSDTNKYNEIWEIDENGTTIEEYLKEKWWITNDYDQWLVKFLQNIVWAYPDGLAGPQTIRMLLDNLGYDWVYSSAESVNSLYADNKNFKINKIKQIEVWDTTYNYNESRIEITKNESWQTIIKIKWQKSLREVLNIKDGQIKSPFWFKIDNGWIISNIDNSRDTIQWYKPSEAGTEEFDEVYSEWLLDILNSNKQDVVDIVQSMDTKYFEKLLDPVYVSMIQNLKPENVFVKLEWDQLRISLGFKNSVLNLYPFTFTISAASILDSEQNYSKNKLAKQLDDYVIWEYVKKQYENIPKQTKSKMYAIESSSNAKINTFLVWNDFNNLNILNLAYIKDGFVMFNMPKTSNGKPIKDLDKLKWIKLDAKQIVKWNDVDMSKLKNLLDMELSEIIWVDINKLSSIKERDLSDWLTVVYKDTYFGFKDDVTKNEFLRVTANSDDFKIKNNVLYDPPSSSASKDQLWYKIEDGKIYKFGKWHNWETAWVFDKNINNYRRDSQRDKHWSSDEWFT